MPDQRERSGRGPYNFKALVQYAASELDEWALLDQRAEDGVFAMVHPTRGIALIQIGPTAPLLEEIGQAISHDRRLRDVPVARRHLRMAGMLALGRELDEMLPGECSGLSPRHIEAVLSGKLISVQSPAGRKSPVTRAIFAAVVMVVCSLGALGIMPEWRTQERPFSAKPAPALALRTAVDLPQIPIGSATAVPVWTAIQSAIPFPVAMLEPPRPSVQHLVPASSAARSAAPAFQSAAAARDRRCQDILQRAQLGEGLSDEHRQFLRSMC